MKDFLGTHLQDRSFQLVHWLSITSISAKDQSRIHQFGKKVLPGLFLGYALYAGGIWKGDIMVADIEEMETMGAPEIYSKKTQCKGSNITRRKLKIHFPAADGRKKLLQEIHVVSVMIQESLETVEKDDRLLVHPTRRQNRLTARAINYSIIIWFTNLFLCLKP